MVVLGFLERINIIFYVLNNQLTFREGNEG